MNRFNVNAPVEYDPEPEGYRAGYAKLHPEIAAKTLFGGLFELPPGQSGRPYHYESAEEWLVVPQGRGGGRPPAGRGGPAPRRAGTSCNRATSSPSRPGRPARTSSRTAATRTPASC